MATDYKRAWLGAEETIRDLEAANDWLREALEFVRDNPGYASKFMPVVRVALEPRDE